MKNLKKFMLSVMAVTMLSLTSCSKDDDGGGVAIIGDATSGTITAKVDGTQFTSLQLATFATSSTGGGQNTLIVQGNSATQGISFTVNFYEGVGTYEISDDNVFIVATYVEPNASDPANSQTWSAPYENSGMVGEFKVTEETDTVIKGTFNFTGKNSNDDSSKTITEGSFNVNKL